VTYKAGKIEGVKYPQLVAVLVNAVKELKADNAAQQAELDRFRAGQASGSRTHEKLELSEIKSLKARIERLERRSRVQTAAN